jgi:hypothetical protein
MAMATVFDVAAYILEKRGTMTAMNLHRLIYYAQAWSLVWDSKPIFDEEIQAWSNGPVCPRLYQSHRGEFEISADSAWVGDPNALSPEQAESASAQGGGPLLPAVMAHRTIRTIQRVLGDDPFQRPHQRLMAVHAADDVGGGVGTLAGCHNVSAGGAHKPQVLLAIVIVLDAEGCGEVDRCRLAMLHRLILSVSTIPRARQAYRIAARYAARVAGSVTYRNRSRASAIMAWSAGVVIRRPFSRIMHPLPPWRWRAFISASHSRASSWPHST